MLTKAQKKLILKALNSVDVKKLEIEMLDERSTKWFRFGSYNGLKIAAYIIKQLPETKQEVS